MKKIFLHLLMCCLFIQLFAQTASFPLTSAYTGMCTYSTFQADAFSFSHNPAALMVVKSFSAGLLGERRFMLTELGSYEIDLVLPVAGGNFGYQSLYFGNAGYNDLGAGMAYARRMGKVDVGIKGSYRKASVRGYAGHAAVTMEGGIIFQLTEKLRMGFHLFNPVPLQLNKSEETSTALMAAGFGYDASRNFHLGITLEKTENQPVNVRAGFHYAFADNIFLRAGISCSIPYVFMGAGCWLQDFRVDAIACWHPQLGMTPGVALLYRKRKS